MSCPSPPFRPFRDGTIGVGRDKDTGKKASEQYTLGKECVSIAYLFPKKWEERFGGVGEKM